MHCQTSTGDSSGPTALRFFILHSVFFTFSLLMQFTSSLTTSASSVLGSLSFFLFISFSKYAFHLFNTASEFTITLLFSSFITLVCRTSFPALSLWPSQSVQLLFTFFCFQCCITNRHMHIFSPSQLPSLPYFSFIYLFSIFISYFVPCFLCLFLFFYALLNFLIPPPCLPVFFSFFKCHSQYSFSCFVPLIR